MLRKIGLFLVLYNFIFPLRLAFAPFSAEVILGASLLYVAATLRKKDLALLGQREVLFTVSMWTGIFCLGTFSVLINGTYDFGISIVLVNYLFTLVYALLITAGIHRGAFGKGCSDRTILSTVVFTCVLVSLSVYLDVFSSAAKQFFLATIYKTGNIDYAESFRASGLSASGGASLSYGLALGAGLALLLAATTDDKTKRLVFYSSAFFLVLSTAFVGRSGVVFALVFVLASVQSLSLGRVAYLSVAIIGAIAAAWILVPMLSDDATAYFSHHVLEVVDNYKAHGKIESATTDAVEDMYFIPSFGDLIMGAGVLNTPARGYIMPDPGYMKVLLALGIFGSLAFYALSARIVIRAYRFLMAVFPRGKLLVAGMMISYFVYEFKEPAFYQNYQFRLLILCFALGIARRLQHRKQSLPGMVEAASHAGLNGHPG